MKNICDIIQDILPLYVDAVCSQESRCFVEEHLAECEKCTQTLERLKQSGCEQELIEEKEKVFGHYAREEKKRTVLAGSIMAAFLMIPVIVCLIVNLATGHALDWFFLVLTSLLVLASVTVVPLVTGPDCFLWTTGCFTASLLLLLFTCCLYSKGRWFWIAASGVLLGLSVILLPGIAKRVFEPASFWGHHKGLFACSVDTFLLYLLLLFIGIYAGDRQYWYPAFSIASICVLFLWIVFWCIRYFKVNGWIRAAAVIILAGVFYAVIDRIIGVIIGNPKPAFHSDLTVWNSYTTDDNITLLVLIVCFVAGVVLLTIGIQRKNRAAQKGQE